MSKEILLGLLQKTPLFLILLGVVTILIGAAGGMSKLPWGIPDLPLREKQAQIVVECVGALVCIFGGWFLVRELRTDEPTHPELKKDYGLTITSHGNNASVSEEFEIKGRFEKKPPPTVAIKLFIRSLQTGDTWPNPRKIDFDDKLKEWTSSIRPGGNPGEKKIVGIALVGKRAGALCDYYDATSKKISSIREERSQLAKRIAGVAGRIPDPNHQQELREACETLEKHVGVPGISNMTTDFVVVEKITVTRV
jgi:hypothetical protein